MVGVACRTAQLRYQVQMHSPLTAQHPKQLATVAPASTALPHEGALFNAAPIQRYHPTQPPSFKPPELRKSQLHRQYTSLLRTSPLILIFQHNNLRAAEFSGIRRELTLAMRKVDAAHQHLGNQADDIRLQVIQSGVFAAALRVVEFFRREGPSQTGPVDVAQQHGATLTHDLSELAHRAAIPRNAKNKGIASFKRTTPLHRILSGPVAVLSFPSVSPQHLAAAMSILLPTPGNSSTFPAPKRKTNPGYYEAPVQSGLQKLLLLGARVEGRVMDTAGTKWVGGIQGGIDGLRAQLVHTLENTSLGLARALESSGNALWVTLESRRLDVDEQSKVNETVPASV